MEESEKKHTLAVHDPFTVHIFSGSEREETVDLVSE